MDRVSPAQFFTSLMSHVGFFAAQSRGKASWNRGLTRSQPSLQITTTVDKRLRRVGDLCLSGFII
jgi:hypothetical protein